MPLTNAQRQSRFRAKQIKPARVFIAESKYADLPGPLPALIGNANVHYCPFCNPDSELVKINLSPFVARKGCTRCKRKFDYIRSDTPEGIAARTYQRRKKLATLNASHNGTDQVRAMGAQFDTGSVNSVLPFRDGE